MVQQARWHYWHLNLFSAGMSMLQFGKEKHKRSAAKPNWATLQPGKLKTSTQDQLPNQTCHKAIGSMQSFQFLLSPKQPSLQPVFTSAFVQARAIAVSEQARNSAKYVARITLAQSADWRLEFEDTAG
ncbi:hypothetical protein WJX82_009003 [Trebouxia sp. C0006]